MPYHQLPSSVAELHRLADRAYMTSRAQTELVRARSALHKAEVIGGATFETMWRLARMDGLLAQHASEFGRQWAQEGREAAAKAVALDPKRPEGHLYLSVCTGLLAKYSPKRADELIKAVIASAERSRKIDPKFAGGEARRVLGAIYIYAPPWPSGVGDLDEAIEILEALVAELPDQPTNLYYLAEAYRKADQRQDALKLYRRVRRFKPKGLWRVEGPHYRRMAKQHIATLKRSP